MQALFACLDNSPPTFFFLPRGLTLCQWPEQLSNHCAVKPSGSWSALVSSYYGSLEQLSNFCPAKVGRIWTTVKSERSKSSTFKGLPEVLQAEMMMIAFLGIVLGVMTVLLAGIFYVRRKEHKEKRTAGVTVIPQQSVHRCPQHYLLMFYTGSGRHSGTTANVFCRIYGNHHKTKPIVLRDPDRPMFQPSSMSTFLVTLSRCLNQIKQIQIWHDISGPNPSWYLEDVIICHLNTNVTWYFEANRWLDVSTGTKEVECTLRPLQRKAYLGLKTLFNAKFNYNVKNKHLWFSPFLSNKRRLFGKFEKMSCCLAVTGIMCLIATVLAETTQSVFPNATARLGPWKLSLGDIYRAAVCSGIAFVVRLLLECFFFNSKRNTTLEANELHVDEHIREYSQKLNAIVFVDENREVDENHLSLDEQREVSGSGNSPLDEKAESKKRKMENEDPCPQNGNGLSVVMDHPISHSSGSVINLSPVEGGQENNVVSCNIVHKASGCATGLTSMESPDVPDAASRDPQNSCNENHAGVNSIQSEDASDGASVDTISVSIDTVTLSDLSSTEGKEPQLCSKKRQDVGDLIDIIGNLPEKEELVLILNGGNNEHSTQNHERHGTIHNNNVLSLNDEDLTSKLGTPKDEVPESSGASNKDQIIKHCSETVAWTETITSPDKNPNLWKQLPFPHQLIDKYGIKKLHSGIPKLPHIVLRITQAQCFILPFVCSLVTIAIGVRWSVSITTSWIMTFTLAAVCQVLVLETLYMLLQAIYFAKWCQRPVREDDLIHELSNKVWVNDDQNLTYYADEVADEEEGELVPRPPTQEDILKAQEAAGRERELEDVLKMLFFNLLFLGLLIFISLGNRDASSFSIRVGMMNSFNISKSFYRVNNAEKFWTWLLNDTIPVLLFDPLDKTPNEGKRHFLTDGYTYVLGTAILRQQRTKPGLTCKYADLPKEVIPECHQIFLTSDNEDKRDYYQGWKEEATSHEQSAHESPWKYLSGQESDTDYTAWGRRHAFHGGGYITDISSERQTALGQLNSLRTYGWVDGLTRAVFLEFSTYNANVNILATLIFSVEFTSYGAALPHFDMYSFRLYRYYTPFQLIFLVCEVIFVVFVVQLINRVVNQMYRDRWIYFTSFWNYTDLLLLLFSLVIIALYSVRWTHLNKAIEAIRKNPNTFYGFITVAFYDEFIAYVSCMIFLIPCLQFMKFLKFNKNFMIFYATLASIKSDLGGFAIVFLVSMLCFTMWSYSMLKTVAESFSTFIGTFYNMISLLLGKFTFRLLSPGQVAAAQVGPLFTYSFTCANVFFILNIILAIITIGFTEARFDERFQQSEYEIVKFIVNFVKDRLGLLPPYIPPPPEITLSVKEKHFTYFQWKLCTSYVTQSQFPRLMNFAYSTYLEDFIDELEMVADLLGVPMSRQVLEQMVHREQNLESLR